MADVLTGECAECGMQYNLVEDGTVRNHWPRGRFCMGSGMRPAEPKPYGYGWTGY